MKKKKRTELNKEVKQVKKQLITAVAAGMGLTFMSLPAYAGSTIKVSTCQIKTHDHVVVFLNEFLKPAQKNKIGLKLRYIGGPEITPFTKQGGLLKRGLIDLIFCPTPYYGADLPEARLPGAHNVSLAEMRKNGAWDMLEEAWNKGLNAHILAYPAFNVSTFYVYTKFKPELSKKTGIDLVGKKMRSTGLYKPFLSAMKATPVGIAPGDVYTGLERGVVDGIAWPKGSVTKYGWEKFLRYKVEPNFYGATFLTIINLDKWKSLTQAERDFLTKVSAQYEKRSDEVVGNNLEADEKRLAKAGVKTVKLEGEYAKAYLRTIYDAKWAVNDKYKNYNVNYAKLKSLMYK
ncbi:MAG: TRAP transporter substrate-binding protein DctP [Rhodospirillaceae bacterium]